MVIVGGNWHGDAVADRENQGKSEFLASNDKEEDKDTISINSE